jgi:hypothetical protein
MKIGVCLPREDVAVTEAESMEADYAVAFEEWNAGDDAAFWDRATGDGLTDSTARRAGTWLCERAGGTDTARSEIRRCVVRCGASLES